MEAVGAGNGVFWGVKCGRRALGSPVFPGELSFPWGTGEQESSGKVSFPKAEEVAQGSQSEGKCLCLSLEFWAHSQLWKF